MKFFLVLLVLFVPALCRGVTVTVGGVSVELPSQPGFVEVTPRMTLAYDLGQQLVQPNSVQFASFIPEPEAAKALDGKMPNFTRRFVVQTLKAMMDRPVSAADFQQLKVLMRTQNDDIIKQIQEKSSGLMGDLGQKFSKRYDTKLALSLSQMVPYPAHEETERAFAYSMLMKFGVKDNAGDTKTSVCSGTLTFLHVKSRVLFLYCYAEEEGLEWTRTLSREWSSAILAANPLPPVAFPPPVRAGSAP